MFHLEIKNLFYMDELISQSYFSQCHIFHIPWDSNCTKKSAGWKSWLLGWYLGFLEVFDIVLNCIQNFFQVPKCSLYCYYRRTVNEPLFQVFLNILRILHLFSLGFWNIRPFLCCMQITETFWRFSLGWRSRVC